MKGGRTVPGRTGAPRRAALYEITWRARDMARQAAYWTARQPGLVLLGTGMTAAGLVLLLFACTVPGMPWWAYLEFGAYCATGITMRQVARHRGRR
jgi:hypothetical protein